MMGPIALVVIVAFFGVLYPDTFLTRTNLVTNVLEVVAVLIIVAAGQTVVMVVGEFDLSVGGVAALSTAVTASFIATSTLDGQPQTPGSVFWSVALGLAIGVGCGLLNGVLVAYLGVLAFIATLGMAQVYTSLANHRVDGKPVFGLVEHNFVDIARGDLLGVSNKIWIVDGLRRRRVAAARPHDARTQDVRSRRQRPRRLPVRNQRPAHPPRRLRRRRARRRSGRHPAGGDDGDGQHVGTAAVDAAVDRRRVPRHGDVPLRAAEPAGHRARRDPAAHARQRSQLHRPQRLPSERHLRSGDRSCGAAPGAGTVAEPTR